MGENNLTLRTLKKVTENKSFFIPSYQRGYRWDRSQVEDLLNDIKEYIDNKEKINSFLCLQPIVVYEKCDKYAVIDGQQRLTTLALIEYYMNREKYCKNEENTGEFPYNLTYEKYEKTLQSILKNVCGKVCEHEIYEQSVILEAQALKIYKDNCQTFNSLDEYHMILSYLVIQKWFNGNKDMLNDEFSKLFKSEEDKYSVKFIWYDVTDQIGNNEQKAIDIFTRLNIGKIPLTDAELIMALFLKKDNFSDSELGEKMHIAYKWDEMEKTLNNDSFWYFLSNDTKTKKDRIELVLELILSNEEYKKYKDHKYKSHHKLFAIYEEKVKEKGHKDLWQQIEKCFMTLREWYNDNEMYHYVGYLIYSKVSLQEIYRQKSQIKYYMYETIKNTLKKDRDNDNIIEQIKQYDFYNDKVYLRRVLLFADICVIIKSNNSYTSNGQGSETFIYKFPFDVFIKEKWDLEHISPQIPTDLNSYDKKKDWFKKTYEYLYDRGQESALKELYLNIQDKNLLSELNDEKSEVYLSIIRDGQFSRILELDIFRLDGLENKIGNLVLLNYDINRSYGNDLYGIKRTTIIDNDKQGRFVPIITKNAFMKYYTKSDDTNFYFWLKDDAKDLLEEVCSIINQYLTPKGEYHGNK